MPALRLLIASLVALLVLLLATSAGAQAQPPNDDYFDAERINEPGDLLQGQFQDLSKNTTDATVQNDLIPGGGTQPEVTRCDFPNGRQVHYGKTVWWDFFPDVDGEVLIQAGGFDAVIGLVPYDDNAVPFYDEWFCADDPALTSNETALFDVTAGRNYSIQIGGYGGEGSTGGPQFARSGQLEFTFTFFPDTDGDGVLDDDDECPETPGSAAHAGCPDSDGDGIRNDRDRCPAQQGEARYGGCRDSDGDGKPDPDDACPTVGGDLPNGCPSPPPRPDADGDGIFDDGPDRCLGENSRARDANNNGCLDLRRLSPQPIFDPGRFFVRRGGQVVILGVSIDRLGVADVPKGTRVVVTCTRRACKKTEKRANSRVIFGKLRGRNLRVGVKVTMRVTKPGYVGWARVYTVGKNRFRSVKTRCLLPGSSKLRRGCSPVR